MNKPGHLKAVIAPPDWLARRALPDIIADDDAAMELAIELAMQNVAHATGGPFGALLRETASGRLLSVGVNQVRATGNPSLHAEVMALSLAGCNGADLTQATLFTSCAPCIMCLGATHWAGVKRIVFSALKEDAEAIGFSEGAGTDALQGEMVSRGVAIEGGRLRARGVEVFRNYVASGGVIYGPR